MKTYTIIGGVNGTGKSSLTGVLRSELDDLGVIIDVDRITAENGGDPLKGGKLAVQRLHSCMGRGVNFTQESTLSGHFVARTAREALEQGYRIRLYYVGLGSLQESLKRIENRVANGGHNIPPDVVMRRFEGRWEALAAVLPYCNEATFFDNRNGFVEVARYANGELLLPGGPLPHWVKEMADAIGGHISAP